MINDVSERDPVDVLAEEFLDRRRRNETPTPDDYARKYPELADQIRSVFPALMMLDELKPNLTAPRSVEMPKQLGEFRILRQIGRGGMGVVYEAVQQSLDRRVALKVLPAEAARDPVYLDRFRSEARTAGRLHHTNIVAVHGAGQADGIHFLVMQLVDGVGLDALIRNLQNTPSPPTVSGRAADTKATDDSQGPGDESHATLPPEPMDLIRLRDSDRPAYYRAVATLMADAAAAVAHAHHLGVVHRDIKPSNLLLARNGLLFVNDFGLAKAEGSADLTRTGLVVGTPRYLAPERLDGVEGPASDVFALGATFYEILTLRPAFDGPTRERLLEQVRNAQPAPLHNYADDVPRDLETICLRTLAREPHRRLTALELSDDLRRWLDGRAIHARRVGPVERFVIWARRNPAIAALTLSLFVALSGGLGVALGLWRTSEGHRIQAEANANTADQRLGQVEKVNEILLDIFGDLDPRGARTDEKLLRKTLGQRLDEAARQIEAVAGGEPRTLASMERRLGVTLTNLGQFDQAVEVLSKTAKSCERLFGPDDADTLSCRHELAVAILEAGRITEAIGLTEDVLHQRERLFGINHVDTVASRGNLATMFNKAGRGREAIELHSQILNYRMTTLGPAHRDTISSRNNLANALQTDGQTAKAIKMQEESYEACLKILGKEHHDTITCANNVAGLYLRTGRGPEAVKMLEENLAIRMEMLGPEHPDTLMCRSHLGDAYRSCKRHDDAIATHEQTLKLRAKALGPLHVDTLRSRANVGRAYREAKRFDDAVAMHQEALRLRTLALGVDHPETLASSNDLAITYRQAGRAADAIRVHEETLKQRREILGPDHKETQASAGNLATAYVADRRQADAERILRELVASRERTLEPDDSVLADTRANLGRSLLAQGKSAEAEPFYRDAWTTRAKADPNGWLTADSRGRLGESLLGQQKFNEAETHLLEAHIVMAKIAATATPEHKARVAYTVRQIVKLYEIWEKPDRVAEWQAKLSD